MADLLFTATSGLRTFQQALNVTGHNVANVNTDGYTRQRVEIGTGTPQLTGGGYVGTGSRAVGVSRLYESYLSNQLNQSYSYQNKYKTTDIYSTQLNGTLGDPNTGIFSTMQGLFQSWNMVSNDPSNNNSARFLLNAGNALQQQVQTYLNTRADLHSQVNGLLSTSVSQVNELSKELVSINKDLGSVAARSQLPPNDLLDKRDQLIKQLNQYMDVRVHENPNGVIDVYSADGKIPLITDNRALDLNVDYNTMQKYDATTGSLVPSDKQEVWIQQPGTGQKIIVTNNLKGGELAGATSFRNDQFARAEDELGLSVVGMSIAMNAQHRQGFDKAGVRGDNVFSLNTASPALMSTASSYASGDNTGTQTLTTTGAPTTSFAYKLTYDGLPANTYTVSDAYSNAVIASAVSAASLAGGVTYNGVTVTTGAGTPSKGDNFMVYSTTDFYTQLEQTAYKDSRNSGTIPNGAITVNLDRTGLSNNASGSKFISNDLSKAADLAQVQLQLANIQSRSYNITYDGSNLTVTDARTGMSIPATQKVDDPVGHPLVSTLRFEGLQVDFDTGQGTLKPGDQFQVRFLNDGTLGFKQALKDPDTVAYRGPDLTVAGNRPMALGNNVNAANMASLQGKKLFLNRTEDVQGAYGLMAGNVGSYHQSNQTSMTTQEALYNQLNQQRDSVSGVSLDEEAANMMRFQQAYQAAAQIMQASQKIFDSIISAM